MPLQIRRGTEAERQVLAVPPLQGELIWITDSFRLYIGDGTTLAKDLTPVTGYGDDNAKDAAASIFTAGTHSGISFTYDGATAIDATVSYPALLQNLDMNGFDIDGSGNIDIDGTVTATSFVGDYKGTITADDSTILVDAVSGSINLSGTVKGDVIPDLDGIRDIGSFSNKFKSIWLKEDGLNIGIANISAIGTAINLPPGSTIGGLNIASTDLVEGVNYRINIIGDDSTIIVNTATKNIIANNVDATNFFRGNLQGDVIAADTSTIVNSLTRNITAQTVFANQVVGNLIGFHLGDVKGSVFGDDSSVIVNGIDNSVTASTLGTFDATDTLTIEGNSITLSSVVANRDIIIDPVTALVVRGPLQIDDLTDGGIVIRTEESVESNGDLNLFTVFGAHDNTTANEFTLGRARGNFAVKQSLTPGDEIFNITYYGFGTGGTNVVPSSKISTFVDPAGTVGLNSVPGKIALSTSNDAGVMVEHLSLDRNGILSLTDNTTTAGSNSGEVDLATSTVAESWLRVKVGGVEYALPLYAINP